MYLYLRESHEKTDGERFFRDAFLNYNERARLGLSRREAESAPCARGPYGKPYFARMPRVHFSISHSGRYTACLFADAEVGLDAEDLAMRRAQDDRRRARSAVAGGDAGCARYLKIARRCFREDERLAAEEAADRGAEALMACFFFVWTRKEAYVKYTGRGLGADFGAFSVLDGALGVRFGGARARPDLALSYCRAVEKPLAEIVFL
jgi:phosphopantetheinyl transferase